MVRIEGQYNKLLLFVVFLVILYLSYLIVRPFLGALIFALLFAYIFYPLYKKLAKKTKKRGLSSLIITFLILFIIIFPLAFVVNTLAREAFSTYTNLREKFDTGFLDIDCQDRDDLICKASDYINEESGVRAYLSDVVRKGTSYIIGSTSSFLLSLPGRFLELFVLFFVLFYLFIDGEKFVDMVWMILPFKKSHQKDIEKQVTDVTSGVVYGYLITALAQGFAAGIAYFVIGLNSPLLWGIMTALVSLLPYFGSAIIWLPISAFLFIQGILTSTGITTWKGIGLFAYGIIVVSNIDNVLRTN